MEIVPVDGPPKSQNPKYDWPKVVRDADAAEGKWLRVHIEGGFSTATVGAIQDGRNNYIDPMLYLVKSGGTFTNDEGLRRCDLYIRRRSPEEIKALEKEKK